MNKDLQLIHSLQVEEHEQAIVVTPQNIETNQASIRTFEKINGKWQVILSIYGFVGKDGSTHDKKEGDHKSPIGKYSIGTAFGTGRTPETKWTYREITDDDVWVDDPTSTIYNTWQRKSENNGRWNSAESMNIPQYEYGFVINHNTENPVPGKGSAIFFHIGENGTEGCTATSRSNVIGIIRWLNPAKNPIFIFQLEN